MRPISEHDLERQRNTQTAIWLDIQRIRELIEGRVSVLFRMAGLENLTSSQANVLVVLYKAERPMSARDIARALSLSGATVSRLVKALMSHGWIRREQHPEDKRTWLIHLTEQAHETRPRLVEVSKQFLSEAFGGVSTEDMEVLSEGLAGLRERLIAAGMGPE
ncbi:MAG: MarR family winged helix-turn-helix transcriptional regulator [Bradymonadia bacterium]